MKWYEGRNCDSEYHVWLSGTMYKIQPSNWQQFYGSLPGNNLLHKNCMICEVCVIPRHAAVQTRTQESIWYQLFTSVVYTHLKCLIFALKKKNFFFYWFEVWLKEQLINLTLFWSAKTICCLFLSFLHWSYMLNIVSYQNLHIIFSNIIKMCNFIHLYLPI